MTTERARGVLLGLACGDALGRPVEFRSDSVIASQHGTLTEMVGHGTWDQPAGTTTDDTAQALCIARSLANQQAFDPADIAARFVEWYDSDPFDVGVMTSQSLRKLKHGIPWEEAGQQVWEHSPEGKNAGNGSVMRCPPLAIPDADPDIRAEVSRTSSQVTHADPRCTSGCAILNYTIAGLLRNKSDPLAGALDYIGEDAPDELVDALRPLATGDISGELQTSGYVVHSLQTALHDGLRAESAENAIVTAVNRGGDTDTIGAIAGAIAGARFGAADLPERWLQVIDRRTELESLADQLAELRLG